MRTTVIALVAILGLGSCKSPPRPPAVNESTRRPANTAAAVDLQRCQSALQNTKLLVDEHKLIADRTALSAAQASVTQPADLVSANTVYTVLFRFGSARVELSAHAVEHIAQRARSSALVVLRARTDGNAPTPGEIRVAQARAESVSRLLVSAGVVPASIRATYQPAGDFIADNGTEAGRVLNRRVEIELYSAKPYSVALAQLDPGLRGE